MNACRICLEPYHLISVCACDGTMKWVHLKCIQEWIRVSRKTECEVCLAPYVYPGLKFYKPKKDITYNRLFLVSFPLGILSGLFLWLDRLSTSFSMEHLFWYYVSITLMYNSANYVLMFVAYRLGSSPIPLALVYYLGFACGCIPGHMGQYLDDWSFLIYGLNVVCGLVAVFVYKLCGEPAH